MFEIIFYVFSFILAYIDYKKAIVPNDILLSMFLMLVIFGILESKLNIISFFIALLVLFFFSILVLINRKMILGGGDIKYMMVVAIFIEPLLFPFFLVITGIFQSILLIFVKTVDQKNSAVMVPSMVLSVVISDFFYHSSYFPF